MRIDVNAAGVAAAGVAAGELTQILRQVSGRLQVICPTVSGPAALAAWASTWSTLRSGLLGLATAGDEFATASRAAGVRFSEMESGLLVPDGR